MDMSIDTLQYKGQGGFFEFKGKLAEYWSGIKKASRAAFLSMVDDFILYAHREDLSVLEPGDQVLSTKKRILLELIVFPVKSL